SYVYKGNAICLYDLIIKIMIILVYNGGIKYAYMSILPQRVELGGNLSQKFYIGYDSNLSTLWGKTIYLDKITEKNECSCLFYSVDYAVAFGFHFITLIDHHPICRYNDDDFYQLPLFNRTIK